MPSLAYVKNFVLPGFTGFKSMDILYMYNCYSATKVTHGISYTYTCSTLAQMAFHSTPSPWPPLSHNALGVTVLPPTLSATLWRQIHTGVLTFTVNMLCTLNGNRTYMTIMGRDGWTTHDLLPLWCLYLMDNTYLCMTA